MFEVDHQIGGGIGQLARQATAGSALVDADHAKALEGRTGDGDQAGSHDPAHVMQEQDRQAVNGACSSTCRICPSPTAICRELAASQAGNKGSLVAWCML